MKIRSNPRQEVRVELRLRHLHRGLPVNFLREGSYRLSGGGGGGVCTTSQDIYEHWSCTGVFNIHKYTKQSARPMLLFEVCNIGTGNYFEQNMWIDSADLYPAQKNG